MTTGQLIKAARKKKKMTQAELAEKLNISYVGVSQWENGIRNPKYDTIRKIADALGVDWSELVPPEDRVRMLIDATVENIDEIANNGGMTKVPERETLQMATLQFNSEEDRTVFFYGRLNTDGMLAAGKFFFRHLKPEDMKDVADYVERLANTPQYQRPQDK
jgi:transcriptional regulator with XRE-family HTH domain